MNSTLKKIGIVIILIALFLGVRYVGSAIRYGCANPVLLDNVPGGDDCPPPFYLAAKLGWLLTGGSLMPLWNRDAIAVEKISWNIEKADSSITSEDDFHFYEQKIAADVMTMDGMTKRYDLGTAHGCAGETKNEISDHKRFFGRVDCSFALSSTKFAAFNQKNGFRIERYDESAKDGSIKTTALVEI
ncbi:hypothetical protein A3C91_00630 [Candidatus Azambacteria bacterium RIFCSPHIGHO2_02_FULL_52_12]|uniref:Uncharacterized protein n=1 Tax=Candidatus Azambacteria bacterium RIFCSPLOWO2_01_FULL_46_25 TaxID=1797298 RepID=A0A1F5BTP0_9BACT|nr:MAG: hypothetical protein A3C91_00630 [Candidatus Azambacteria bacterium RIFCSPHIGHO2_02_FULL_52_12]OGD33944.1 MAG: hypothetical protein A2988_00420 [Candidatus Azambacteria bacterium RIFCSPLOWO2_01_FULL_46_25]OGD37630.1 MAG: hypothetical protein A2850_04495 [Candidatus Azambacteria bacterium RIFCSPHIGHO2_01_FULL_51_74]